jgi:hypothetical protein
MTEMQSLSNSKIPFKERYIMISSWMHFYIVCQNKLANELCIERYKNIFNMVVIWNVASIWLQKNYQIMN